MPREKGTKNTSQMTINQIIKEHTQGKTVKQLSEEYGKPYKTIKNMITRENNKKKSKKALPKQRGRRPAKTLQEYKYENKRLKMENELMRDFLLLTERK